MFAGSKGCWRCGVSEKTSQILMHALSALVPVRAATSPDQTGSGQVQYEILHLAGGDDMIGESHQGRSNNKVRDRASITGSRYRTTTVAMRLPMRSVHLSCAVVRKCRTGQCHPPDARRGTKPQKPLQQPGALTTTRNRNDAAIRIVADRGGGMPSSRPGPPSDQAPCSIPSAQPVLIWLNSRRQQKWCVLCVSCSAPADAGTHIEWHENYHREGTSFCTAHKCVRYSTRSYTRLVVCRQSLVTLMPPSPHTSGGQVWMYLPTLAVFTQVSPDTSQPSSSIIINTQMVPGLVCGRACTGSSPAVMCA